MQNLFRFVCVALLISSPIIRGQEPTLVKEYIHAGVKLVAIEKAAGQSSGGSVAIRTFPATMSLGAGQTQQVRAFVSGSANTNVEWTITPHIGGGTLSSYLGSGPVTYTAPAATTNGQTVTLTARSVADSSKTATILVTFYSSQQTGDFPLGGSFLNFYRNFPLSHWAQEFDWMRQISMSNIVVVAAGGLRPDSADSTGYSLSGEGLLYPSMQIDSSLRPTTDRLEMILSLADQRGMKVYLGSLQTYNDWSTGTEFDALRKWNKLVAQEILANYGHHPSLEGWYFTQELWMNWIKYYGATYYGLGVMANYVTDMKSLDAKRPVSAAVVFKKDGYGAMPGIAVNEIAGLTQTLLTATQIAILMPQDGAGAEAGAPLVSDLPSYFEAMRNGIAGANTGAVLWSTVETFTAIPNVSNDRYPPASAGRIQSQVNSVRPYVSGFVNWIYGNDMSPQATYYPVEGSGLERDYRARFRPNQFVQVAAFDPSTYTTVPSPSSYYPDSGDELANHSGGGYNGYSFTDWAGFPVESSGGLVTISADLGSARALRQVRVLSMSMTNSGIYHPQNVTVQWSNDGVSWSNAGSSTANLPNTVDFSVAWTEVALNVTARYVRCVAQHQSWLFLSEMEMLGTGGGAPPPQSVGVSINPPSAEIYSGQALNLTATVVNAGNPAVTWEILFPNQGSLSSVQSTSATYQSLPNMTSASTAVVKATSVADPTKFAQASITIRPETALTDMVGPISPSSGTIQRNQLLHFEARASVGTLTYVSIVMHELVQANQSCFVQYAPASGTLSLSADSSSNGNYAWAGHGVPGSAGVLQNSQCAIDLGLSSVVGSASSMALNLSITFKQPYWGTNKNVFMAAGDTGGNQQQWPYVGNWNIP